MISQNSVSRKKKSSAAVFISRFSAPIFPLLFSGEGRGDTEEEEKEEEEARMYGILLPPETKLEFFVSPPPPACPRFPKNIYECEAPAFIFFWWKPALLIPHKMSKSGTHAPIQKKPTMFSFFSPVLFYMGSCAIATRKKIIMPAHTLLWRTKNKKCDLLKKTKLFFPCTECGEWIGKRQWRHFALLLGAREQLARDLALKLTDYNTETREVKSFPL